MISDDDNSRDRDIRNLHTIADAFKPTSDECAAVFSRVAALVRTWPEIAREIGIPENQFEEMSAAFDEGQLARAEALRRHRPRALRSG